MKKIGFIGVGNMGSAILSAVVKTVSPDSIYISDFDKEKIETFSKTLGVNASDNETIAGTCDYIFLGVKPQVMGDLLAALSPVLKARSTPFVLISMAAGVKFSAIFNMLSFNTSVIRIMPNLPVSVGEGMTLYSHHSVNDECLHTFLDIMSKTGTLLPLDEELIDAGCSVSGCGPAFVCMVIDALASAGTKCGLSQKTADILALQTLLGTCTLLDKTNTSPDTLKKAVCSPGGSTIEGVKSLERDGLGEIISNAVSASYTRNVELGK